MLLLSLVLGGALAANAGSLQTKNDTAVVVTLDHADWVYKTGEKAVFTISVTVNGQVLENLPLHYEIGPEKMAPGKSATVTPANGRLEVDGGTLKKPGFLRCTVRADINGHAYTGMGTAAFSPLEIQPTTTVPGDFTAFWDSAKAQAARIPMDVKITPLPDKSDDKVKVFLVSIQSYQYNSHVYGILCVPGKEGKYPAILEVPGAGVRPYYGDKAMAEKGVITFQIGIHGIPVTMNGPVYEDLRNGALNGYQTSNLDDRDHYYYKRVYMGCIRAIDYIFSLPSFDGQRLAVSGGSQGGALAIVTAALDNRVKCLASFYPALSDLTGYLHNRAGGWPHLFTKANAAYTSKPDKINTSRYYDVVNFARLLKVPGYYSWGYNDVTCPPTSTYSAYNVITAPKQLLIEKETGHFSVAAQRDKKDAWLLAQLAPVTR